MASNDQQEGGSVSLSNNPYELALRTLTEKLESLEFEYEEASRSAKEAAKNQVGSNMESTSMEFEGVKKEVNYLTKEMAYLRKSVPEGLPEDEEFQYFLAVAEIQKNIEELQTMAKLSEGNLDHVKEQCENMKMLLENEEDLQRKLISQSESSKGNVSKRAKTTDKSEEAKVQDLDSKIRATKKVYKELKTFLGDYLYKVSHDEKDEADAPLLGLLIQALWDKFYHDGQDSYVKISHLEHDVNPRHLAWLKQFEIVEQHPDDEDRIRMINFTG